jgi:hypothetical protein
MSFVFVSDISICQDQEKNTETAMLTNVTSLYISTIGHFRPYEPCIFRKLTTCTIPMTCTIQSLNPQIQIHKCTNTQIQLQSKLHVGTTCAIFLKRVWYDDLKYRFSINFFTDFFTDICADLCADYPNPIFTV